MFTQTWLESIFKDTKRGILHDKESKKAYLKKQKEEKDNDKSRND
jgi:hypothetical protein